MRRYLSGNQAVAEAVRLCRTQIVAAYPITPQTPIYERLSDWDAAGQLGGIMMRVESEHSALAACLAASLAGARTFTATSSQGLALMHEMLHFTSGSRAPVVMAGVNRSLAAPWGFWADQTDSLAQRDTGWIQIYCEGNQESLDSIIQAFRVAEAVLLPCLVNLEANLISHFTEPVEVPEQEAVDQFLPPVSLPRRFEFDRPGCLVPVCGPEDYFEHRRLMQAAMAAALEAVREAERDFGRLLGRSYGLVEAVGLDGAELALVTAGTITSTARLALARLREAGRRVGLVKIRLFRPFPSAELRRVLQGVPRIAVIDRNISLGREGIFCSELKAALGQGWIQGYLAGLGGADVGPELIERIARDALTRDSAQDEPVWMRKE